MKTMSNSFSTKLILLATPLLFNQAHASQAYASYNGDCGTLHLIVTYPIYQKYRISSAPVVHRGAFTGCKEVDSKTGDCTDFEFSQYAGLYGPDIDIEFKQRNGNKTAMIRVQQNFCFLEAGDITVEQKKGVFNYKKFPGSFDDHRPGVVTIIAIEAQ
ncbi:MAG: hypothetical protein LPH21_16160 [Shewanella sp.]|nr:hypothetical protein [Shewanella sp.]